MAQLALASAVLMGVFLLAIVALAARIRHWERGSVTVPGERPPGDAVVTAARDPTVWTVAFAVLVFVFVAGALAFVGGLPMLDGAAAGVAVMGAFAVLLVLYFAVGVYVAARGRGLKSSQAAGVSSILLGLLVLVAIVWQLVTAG